MNKTYTVPVQTADDGEFFIDLPQEVVSALELQLGDTLKWVDNKDGSYMLSRSKTEWVLVETVSTFRHRYMVEVPFGYAPYALDTVVMEDAKDFSQEHIGEQIVSSRVVTKEEALLLCDQDNDYCIDWPDVDKTNNFFTTIADQTIE